MVRDVLRRAYPDLCHVFKMYCCVSTTSKDPFSMAWDAFSSLVDHAKVYPGADAPQVVPPTHQPTAGGTRRLPPTGPTALASALAGAAGAATGGVVMPVFEEPALDFTLSHVECVFIATNVVSDPKKKNASNPDRGLTRFEFLEALVRLAKERFVVARKRLAKATAKAEEAFAKEWADACKRKRAAMRAAQDAAAAAGIVVEGVDPTFLDDDEDDPPPPSPPRPAWKTSREALLEQELARRAIKPGTVAAGVYELVHGHVLKHCGYTRRPPPHPSTVPANEWRTERLYNEAVHDVFKRNEFELRALFNDYGGTKKKPGEKTFVHYAEWLSMLEHQLEWLPAAGCEPGEKFLNTEEALSCYVLSSMMVEDEMTGNRQWKLYFADFLEAIARVAETKNALRTIYYNPGMAEMHASPQGPAGRKRPKFKPRPLYLLIQSLFKETPGERFK